METKGSMDERTIELGRRTCRTCDHARPRDPLIWCAGPERPVTAWLRAGRCQDVASVALAADGLPTEEEIAARPACRGWRSDG
jgi:hypothetical protein